MSFTVWLTGLPASGKTTLARRLEQELDRHGTAVQLLDSDEISPRIERHLTACAADRDTRARMLALSASLLNENAIACVVASTSPSKETRRDIAEVIDNYIEVFVSCPLSVAEERDPKGLYKMARRGIIDDFTGIGASYDEPVNPAITVDTANETIEECVSKILNSLDQLSATG